MEDSARSGYHSVTPYLVVEGVERLIGFLVAVFDASERGEREIGMDGLIDHTEVQIGDSVIMLSEASVTYPARPSVHFVYVPDVDGVFDKALAAGATAIAKPAKRPWGDRVGGFHDPFDNRWWVGTAARDS